jgi:hypothetical protein
VLADDGFAEAIADNTALTIEQQGRKQLKGIGGVQPWRLRPANHSH